MTKKEIKVTTIQYDYVAADGEVFSDADVCAKYEKSLACVLRTRLNEMNLLLKSSEYKIYGTGCDENDAWVVVPKDKADVDRIRQVLAACGGYGVDSVTDDFIGKPVVVTIGYDNEWAMAQSVADLVKNMTDGKWTITKVEENKK